MDGELVEKIGRPIPENVQTEAWLNFAEKARADEREKCCRDVCEYCCDLDSYPLTRERSGGGMHWWHNRMDSLCGADYIRERDYQEKK